ncbi:hypothetical protein ACO0K0_17840 [Undibacterium sp. SXout11W]|uniref:hypothetical protein n=1 Tax=Undibacterium sp. SXout11W TaxID=3413050 RepID=UPI003BF38A5F
MIISSSQVALQSVQHISSQFSARQELRIFGGAANDVPDKLSSMPDNSSLVQISDIGKAALATFNLVNGNSGMGSGQVSSSPGYATNATSNSNTYTNIDPKMQALIELLQEIFGQTIHLINPADFSHTDQPPGTALAPTSTPQGGGAIYNAQTTLTQTTSTSFSAEGDIETSDHKKIHFDLNQSVQTIRQETHSVTIKSGSALKDPLVINFSGNSVQLGQQTFSFDLNNNGKKVTMPFIQGGGYLAYNPDDSEKITDKTQLFGPTTGNGFTQLQSMADSFGNNNGWIDQSNPAYSKLGVLIEGSDGKPQFVSLQQAGIGALYLGSVSTHTAIGDNSGGGGSSGELESSGIYLNNNGSVGSMQDVEVNVLPTK